MFKNSCIKTGWYMYQLVSQWRVPAILLRTRNHWKPIVSTKIINAQTEFQHISESKLAGQHATCFHFHWRYLSFVRVWCAIFTTFFFTIHAILTSSCALCLYSCWRRELRDLSPEGHLEVGSASVRECCERRYKPCVLVFPERGLKKTQHRATILNKFIRPPFIKTKKTQIFKKSVKNELKAKNHIVTY